MRRLVTPSGETGLLLPSVEIAPVAGTAVHASSPFLCTVRGSWEKSGMGKELRTQDYGTAQIMQKEVHICSKMYFLPYHGCPHKQLSMLLSAI